MNDPNVVILMSDLATDYDLFADRAAGLTGESKHSMTGPNLAVSAAASVEGRFSSQWRDGRLMELHSEWSKRGGCGPWCK
jgi:hypothetical protein